MHFSRPEPSSSSLYFSPPLLPPFSSLPLWGGITQENRKGGPSSDGHPLARMPPGNGLVGDRSGPSSAAGRLQGGDKPGRPEAPMARWGQGGPWAGTPPGQQYHWEGCSQGAWLGLRKGWGPPGDSMGQWSHLCLSPLRGLQQAIASPPLSLGASASSSVQMGSFCPALPTSQGCCEELTANVCETLCNL